jgi:hypothetical protein
MITGQGQRATISEMQDRELYRRILGIEASWCVDSVNLKLEEGVVHVRLVERLRNAGAISLARTNIDLLFARRAVGTTLPRDNCAKTGYRPR